jgi:hypothetical protein
VWEGEYGANTLNTCMKMEKMRLVETVPGMVGGRVKENDGGGEFNSDIFDIL